MSDNNSQVTSENERRTLLVIIITLITMVAEIVYGYLTNSMGLLADGYHMGTHGLALVLTWVAYVLIRKFSGSPLFPNGTDKIGTLAAYTSSIFLGFTGIWIIIESCNRFMNPLQINFNDAILVAVIGLLVNIVCIFIMEWGNEHKCTHSHDGLEEHTHEDEDYNFKAAYYHILADALTSILAIAALLVGKYFGYVYFDSLIGILGGIMILQWTATLLKNTVKILIDMKVEKISSK